MKAGEYNAEEIEVSIGGRVFTPIEAVGLNRVIGADYRSPQGVAFLKRLAEIDAASMAEALVGISRATGMSNAEVRDALTDLGERMQLNQPLSETQLTLLADAHRRHEEKRNAKLTKSRQSLKPRAGGPARRSAGRNYGTIGARYYGASQRLKHIFEKLNAKKYGRAR